ncbi:MAG: hypothetical protein BWY75_03786 [bacterium ADurb.Bin425]|nr:MAG: hypothetical protein BWY75_03786 [bacterium ADurb.Bin425]
MGPLKSLESLFALAGLKKIQAVLHLPDCFLAPLSESRNWRALQKQRQTKSSGQTKPSPLSPNRLTSPSPFQQITNLNAISFIILQSRQSEILQL